jgi:SAM-dependent methyltransferase
MKHNVLIKNPPTSAFAAGVLLARRLHKSENKNWLDFREKFLKKKLAETGELQCEYCRKGGLLIDVGENPGRSELAILATIDHVIPLSKGGEEKDEKISKSPVIRATSARGILSMHDNSYRLVKEAVGKYLNPDSPLKILDVGSKDINGNYRPLFDRFNWKYTGIDIEAGPNVDIVVDADFQWQGIEKDAFDVVVCGQVFEHVKATWRLAERMGYVCKAGGICIVVVPWNARYHPYPIDCWRIMLDGIVFLMTECARFENLECYFSEDDTFFVGKKLGP